MPRTSRTQLDSIRPETASLFTLLASYPQLETFTLIGGTAIALNIGHRLSNDLDFAVFGDKLPTSEIDHLVTELKSHGLPVRLISAPDQISTFKIRTGKKLLDYARDYMFGNTKVTFFAMGMQQTPFFVDYLKQAAVLNLPDVVFNVLALDGLRASKAVALGQRVRSRDLYDLFILAKDHGYHTAQLLRDAVAYGTNDDPEYYKAVLRGEIPLDADDEGLEPVGVSTELKSIYSFFDAQISQVEIEEAERIAHEADQT